MLKLNEREIIAIFQKKLGNKKFVSEDVEVFRIGKVNLVTKVDTLVESTDIPLGMKLKDVARKSCSKGSKASLWIDIINNS
jgi:thiamine-monophosphate kinase